MKNFTCVDLKINKMRSDLIDKLQSGYFYKQIDEVIANGEKIVNKDIEQIEFENNKGKVSISKNGGDVQMSYVSKKQDVKDRVEELEGLIKNVDDEVLSEANSNCPSVNEKFDSALDAIGYLYNDFGDIFSLEKQTEMFFENLNKTLSGRILKQIEEIQDKIKEKEEKKENDSGD